ncbi:helix-turn-helix domain-containing protein [Streptomyces argyrophyllae]|uniref:Helix-turn-helix domain-containing protein n=1 Tax=Streptomyces argyrophylli TaxID=2726118 RepID=A0A6M4PQ30_9ACTN|nr:helix-turn-helix transcriptional regulator [Streptomyces argyrophyllae]QJS13225.1 helix-turn-helix domain-containing protein [Streptomyces argyrophyllae]
MEQFSEKDFNARLADRVGRLVARAREGAGGRKMSAQALAARCAELGHPLDRSVIAKLEKGIRQTVTVADLLVLARALDVPPVTLLVPLDEAEVELMPGESRPVWPAVLWFSAEAPYPAPAGQDGEPQRWEPPLPIALFRQHDDLVRECLSAAGRAADHRMQSTLSSGDERVKLQAAADADAELAVSLRDVLKAVRRSLRAVNQEPPALPKALSGLDQSES